MNTAWSIAIAGMWLGAAIGSYGSAPTSGAPFYFVAAAIVTGMIVVRLIPPK